MTEVFTQYVEWWVTSLSQTQRMLILSQQDVGEWGTIEFQGQAGGGSTASVYHLGKSDACSYLGLSSTPWTWNRIHDIMVMNVVWPVWNRLQHSIEHQIRKEPRNWSIFCTMDWTLWYRMDLYRCHGAIDRVCLHGYRWLWSVYSWSYHKDLFRRYLIHGRPSYTLDFFGWKGLTLEWGLCS